MVPACFSRPSYLTLPFMVLKTWIFRFKIPWYYFTTVVFAKH